VFEFPSGIEAEKMIRMNDLYLDKFKPKSDKIQGIYCEHINLNSFVDIEIVDITAEEYPKLFKTADGTEIPHVDVFGDQFSADEPQAIAPDKMSEEFMNYFKTIYRNLDRSIPQEQLSKMHTRGGRPRGDIIAWHKLSDLKCVAVKRNTGLSTLIVSFNYNYFRTLSLKH